MLMLKDVWKHFGGTVALKGVSLEANDGTIHAIVGQNGSGKSTLMKILAGVYTPDKGEILLDNQKLVFSTPREAEQHSIGIVYQELSLFPHLSGFTNIMIGHEPRKGIIIDQHEVHKSCQAIMADLGYADLNLNQQVKNLRMAEQQLIEIAKVLVKHPRIFILDEPTAALTIQETEKLFEVLQRLKAQGIITLFISHHLEEIFRIADQVTVMRDGAVILSDSIKNLDETTVVNAMIGRQLEHFYPTRHGSPSQEILLETRDLMGAGIGPINLTLHKGEILGIGGGVGAGQTALAYMLAGVKPIQSGTLLLQGKPVHLNGIRDSIAHGISLVPEDRRTEGLFLNLSLKTNLSLPLLSTGNHNLAGFGFIRRGREFAYAQEMEQKLSIKIANVAAITSSMSGGNQQKAAIARWVGLNTQVLVLNDPTKGIDIGARSDIYEVLNRLADSGVGIIMISSQNPELLSMCERIIVLYRGKVASEFQKSEATEDLLVRAASALV